MGDITEFWPILNPDVKPGLFFGDMNYCFYSIEGFPTTSYAIVEISSFLPLAAEV